jgi:hypothetical protein
LQSDESLHKISKTKTSFLTFVLNMSTHQQIVKQTIQSLLRKPWVMLSF